MKPLLLFFLLRIGITQCLAQETTWVLDTTMFNTKQQINLATTQGWVYHPGHNPAWASPQLSTSGWLKRNPTNLSIKGADQTGRVEGWFRLKIRLDSTFKTVALSLTKRNWAAIDFYLDGRLTASFGNTGANHKPYKEYNPYYKLPLPLQLVPQQEYLIAVHFVDYPSPYASHKLKSEVDNKANSLIELQGPQTITDQIDQLKNNYVYFTLWLVVTSIMTLLFWLLPFQSQHEKTIIRLLAIWGTIITLHNLGYFMQLFDLPFTIDFITDRLTLLLYFVSVALLVAPLFHILGRALSPKMTSLIIAISVIGGLWSAYTMSNTPGSVAIILQSFAFLYLIATSWKTLRGAQWAIVAGASLTILFNIAYAVATFDLIEFTYYYVMTGSLITLPIFFIIYIVLRFREMLAEDRAKAAAVTQITEEKRQLLATQNELLEQQVETRTAELNQSLTELKATQTQLIQKEKLASLGELTAGIAHEIQNPLNFVNNFSEVSTELIDELKEEAQAGRTDDVLTIASDLTANLQKIHHHGGRAAAIVRGMLEHSRVDSGEKRSIDLNALAQEYLNIAYHGLRAKDKEFDCELVREFDPTLKPVEVSPQEIGRVLLNLYNNAFYAVSQRGSASRTSGVTANQIQYPAYKPTIGVSTTQESGKVLIRVRDNGTGIPDAVKAKIFQPFFTTKPTGEGTGLGLSLSYDIITKGHSGTLRVESQAGEGSTLLLN